MQKLTVFTVVLGCLCVLAGCGKYAPPRPPEDFSTGEVQSLEVVAELQGIKFRWRAPDEDQRSRELKTIDGYRIYRKEVGRDSDIIDDSIDFELVASIEDTHLLELDKLREEAEQAGKIKRKAKVPDEKLQFEYTDLGVQAGKTYAYQIIPYNQKDVEGRYSQIVKVQFRGDSSDVFLMPYSYFREEAALED
jgi:hypothetical protein